VDSYEDIALNLLKGKGYSWPNNDDLARRRRMNWPEQPTAMRPPVYPLFLYQLYKIVGVDRTPALFMQAIFDTGACFFVYLIAQRLFANQLISLLSSLLWSFYLPGILITKQLFSEPMFTFLLSGTMLLMIKAFEKEQSGYFLAGGIGFGLASLCRPIVLFFPLIWSVLFILKHRSLKASKKCFLLFLGYGFTLTPWIVRNYRHFDQFIPGDTHSSYTMYAGNATLGDDDYFKYLSVSETNERVEKALPNDLTDPRFRFEALIDDALLKKSFELIRDYPLRYLALCLNRFFVLWFNNGLGMKVGVKSVAYALGSLFFFITAFKAMLKTTPWTDSHTLVWGLIGFVTFTAVLVRANWRSTIPLMPYIFIFSSAYVVKSGIIRNP
jgi:4-amino-4-deoxy-L-arabinose transferase-like glycosyltransferase